MVKLKKPLQILFISLLYFFLSSCQFQDFLSDNDVEIDTINYISTVVVTSNVKVTTETYEYILGLEKVGPHKGTGSGVIFHNTNDEYYVLTNAHVVHLSDDYHHRYYIDDSSGNSYQGSLFLISKEFDLAILKFESQKTYIPIAFSNINPEIGEIVFSIGSPSGQANIITAGKILQYKNIEQVDYEILLHDALVKPGSSGSMLINQKFEIVGINTWGFEKSTKSAEEFVYGGATPIEKILEFINKEPLFNQSK